MDPIQGNGYQVWTARYGTVNVKDFGAHGDGVHDDTAAIQAAIDAAGTAGGGTVLLPQGTYSISQSLTIPYNAVTLAGPGMFSANIRVAGSFDAIVVSNSSTGTRITSLSITSSVTQTAGAGIRADSTGNAVYTTLIDNVYFATYNGIELYNTNTTTILHCRMNCDNYGLYCGNGCRIVRFTNAEVGGNAAGVFLDGGCQSIKLLQLEMFSNAHAVVLDTPNGGSAPNYVYMYDVEANPGSDVVGPYFYINNAGEVHLTECWSDAAQAIQINGGTVTILGGRYGNGGPPAIGIAGGESTTIVGASIAGVPNEGAAIVITGGGNVRVIGCIFGLFGDALAYAVTVSDTYTGDYGVQAGGTTGNILISGNSLGPTVYQIGNGYDIQCAAGLVTITDNYGANPYGSQTAPSVPTSGTALTNPFPVNVQVVVTGGTVSSIAIDGTDTGLTSGMVMLTPGQTITLTYTAAPAWTWFGL